MANEKTVLLCDNSQEQLMELNESLTKQGFAVASITDATQLVSEVQRQRPALVAVNPDMKGFNAYDVCKKIKQDLGIPIILMIDANSSSRNTIDACTADDVVHKPVDKQIISFLLQNNFAMHSKNENSSGAVS
jgi:DNA-binding response OmpR family regulator